MTNTDSDNHDNDDDERMDLPPAISLEREEVVKFNLHPNRPSRKSR